MKRFEIPYTSIFPAVPYDMEGFIGIARKHGAKNPRRAYHLGWNNQPKVLRFSASRKQATAIQEDLKKVSQWIKVVEVQKGNQ